MLPFVIALLFASVQATEHPCQRCHPAEVAGYAKSAMAHSLRKAAHEPSGVVVNGSGSEIEAVSRANGEWQILKQNGSKSEFRIDYAIGSGKHATGYLVKLGDHLFQSPIAYYPQRSAYGLAPGYEGLPNPDFTRPVNTGCLFCHADRTLLKPGVENRYEPAVFEHLAISCERCHGAAERHLLRPISGSIVNPARLTERARDSVCEQCHLSGAARILDPGKTFGDFRPGQTLEEVFTVYINSPQDSAAALKVISHPEQLAASLCARQSKGKLWCGTCHDPHKQPADRVAYYRARCLTCHGGRLPQTHSTNSDCISCHMPRRSTYDGAHTAFTDHRITRLPTAASATALDTGLVAWRQPEKPFVERNLALANLSAGIERRSASMIVSAYKMLTQLQQVFPSDPAIFSGIGSALLLGGKSDEARFAFDRVAELQPSEPAAQENLARCYLSSQDIDAAIDHLEKAVDLDPLSLSAVALLQELYRKTGQPAKESELERKVSTAMAQ